MLGGDAEFLLAETDHVVEGWLDELKESGSGLLDACGRGRLRRALRRCVSRNGRGGWDGGSEGPPEEIQEAASALRRRVGVAATRGSVHPNVREALLAACNRMAEAAEPGAKERARDLPSDVLARASLDLQRATTAQGVVRVALRAAIQLCDASGAIWWEQGDGGTLVARAARGLRVPRGARSFRPGPEFWKDPAHPCEQALELSTDNPRHAGLLETLGFARGLMARMRTGGRWAGALSVHDARFDAERRALLTVLAQHAGTAAHALTLAAEKRQLSDAQHRSIAELGFALSSALSLEELLQLLCGSAAELVHADTSAVFLDEGTGRLTMRAQAGKRIEDAEEVEALTAFAEQAREQPPGQPLWRTGERSALHNMEARSALGLGLPVRGEPLGALVLLGEKANAFTATERQMLCAFGAQAAVAIENVGLVEDMQRRLLEMADLTWVSARMSATLEAESIAATIADATAKAFDMPRVALFLAGPNGELRPVPGGDLGFQQSGPDVIAPGDHIGRQALATGVVQAVADATQEERAGDAVVAAMGARSLLAGPMSAPQGLRGLLVVADEEPRTFPSHVLAVLSAYANETALALQSALLYQDVRKHLQQLSDLFGVTQALASSLDLSDTLTRVLDAASDLLDAPVCSLMLVDPDTRHLTIKAARGLRAEDALGTSLKPGEGLAGRAMESQQPLTSADIQRDGRFKHRAAAREGGLRTAVVAPLIARDRTVGVLNLYRRTDREFTEQEQRLAMTLANSAAVAIDNANLYAEAQERAEFLSAMMGEINHRMRNTLQAVAGLLRMEMEQAEPRPTAEVLKRGVARLQSVAVVHDMMQARDVRFVDIKQAAGRIVQLTCQTVAPERAIATRVSGARVQLPSQQATDVAIILSELVDNALRHGLRGVEEGRISVSLADGGGNVVIEVTDNGQGPPDGFDLENGAGLGLKVVRGLVEEELGGTLELEQNKGTTVRAKFPKHV